MPQSATTETPALSFQDDGGVSRSKWVAAALILALLGWMASGFVLPGEEPDTKTSVADAPREIAVAVRESRAEPVTRIFSAEGQAQPDRLSSIRTEATGEIAEVAARKGEAVEAAQIIARVDNTQRQAELERAQEELTRAERDFRNAETLLERGASTLDRIAETRSALAAARAQVAAAEEALENTIIRAPFAGTLDELTIEVGEYVTAGEEVGEIVDGEPLTVVIQVPQQSLSALEVGQDAEVSFITGQVRQGEVAYIGVNADAETRTFRAEIVVPNQEDPVPSGVSAEVRIPVGETVAHFLSPAVLSLGSDGALGVKTVDDGNRVEFHEVEIVRAQTDGIWISGLPDEVRIITIGQGFVSAGEAVAPRTEDEVATLAATDDRREMTE
ncbi:efflux RND transporter periplasmic adaptor subunit [Rhodobacteraceae bacterium MCCB 386]|nr:efflux RND transporter periplasmic adaptor subunit [Roseitranquillus sediminis]